MKKMVDVPGHRCEFDVTGVCIHCGKGKEREEALQNEVNASLKLCWNTAKKIATDKGVKELYAYVNAVNPFDTSNSELKEGFIREPITTKEWEEAELHYSEDGFEWSDTNIHEADTGDCKGCKGYLKKVEQ